MKPGQVLVRLDATTLESQLAEANAAVAAAQERISVAKAAIARQQSEIELAKIEADRSKALVAENAGSQRELDVRNTALATTQSALAEEQARLAGAVQDVLVARANVATIQSRIDDATLMSPVTGRVLYRLAEPGEVLAAGGKALTLVNLKTCIWRSSSPPSRPLRSRSAPTRGSLSTTARQGRRRRTSASCRRKRSSRRSRSRRKASARS